MHIVSEEKLKSGLMDLSAKSLHPVISIDRAYVDETFPNLRGFVDITRMVDPSLKDIGLYPRQGALPIEDQINQLLLLMMFYLVVITYHFFLKS